MLYILSWIVYGLVVGLIAKSLHPGEDPVGFLPTIGIGIIGSYVGGFIYFLLGRGDAFSTSGIVMGVIGGVIFCWAYQRWHLDKYLKAQNAKIESLELKVKAKDE